jgi:hypothetical protein
VHIGSTERLTAEAGELGFRSAPKDLANSIARSLAGPKSSMFAPLRSS